MKHIDIMWLAIGNEPNHPLRGAALAQDVCSAGACVRACAIWESSKFMHNLPT
jgi:hypothetical protein